MIKISKHFPNEYFIETRKYLNSKDNWDAKKKKCRMHFEDYCNINLKDCQIYWRGGFLIVEYKSIVLYWEMIPNVTLKYAVEYFNPQLAAEWKTVDRLISLRMALYQPSYTIKWDVINKILNGKEMTLDSYNEFMKQARQHELRYKGTNTF